MSLSSAQIRQAFIDFFVQKHGHTFVPSSPVVPHDDPTLLFANAGMNQFKPIFLGLEKRSYVRAANTQKCIRAGGKHNDLDDVGRSRRHHTFFEMLGNWSFGDYFKREAIAWAWELLTEVWKVDASRLHVTCYRGGDGVERDVESASLWREIAGLPADHIHFLGADNFWEMGDTGPCGPCTEIHIDRTPDGSGGRVLREGHDDPRVMEIWNLVFIQYNRNPDRSLTPLPARHVDTGMGFERMCQVLQGAGDNYATDLWQPLFSAIAQMCGRTYTGQFPPTNAPDAALEAADPQLRTDIAFRVIADHVRCLTFALTDGAVPSNEGRGYVLRRILRRAARFGRQTLELGEPFMHRLVPVVVETMSVAFPELRSNPSRVQDLIRDEEISFGRTLDRGIALFDEAAQRSHDTKRISGEDAFKLHDTYGFPVDLTQVMAQERGLGVDIADYERLMEEARQRARAGGKAGASRLFAMPPDVLATLAERGVRTTDDSAKFNAMPIGARVVAIWDGVQLINETHGSEAAGQGVAVILDQTCFYAEQGGQVGDTGELRSTGGAVMSVATTRAAGGYVLHVGNMIEGHLRVGDHVTATLAGVRPRTQKNHTATHLANWALREVLGDDVQQKGSLVDPDRLRFDFSHSKAMTDEEIGRVESLVAGCIERRMTVYAEPAPQEQALKITGLRAVFGEKYPPVVRVVSIGVPVADLLADPANPNWRKYSIEFCGGTHVGSSDEAGAFVITGEESVSKGVRRILALTGDSAREALSVGAVIDDIVDRSGRAGEGDVSSLVAVLTKALASPSVPLRARRRGQATLQDLQARQKAWEKSQTSAAGGIDVGRVADQLLEDAASLAQIKLIVQAVPDAAQDQLLAVIDSIRKRAESHAVLLATVGDGKIAFVAAVSDDVISKGLKAGDWVRETARVAGGGGGGRPQMAQAGGKDPAKLEQALERARGYASEALKASSLG